MAQKCVLCALLGLVAVTGGNIRVAAVPTPIGLSLFFVDGAMAPLTLAGDAPRYLQEIDITASVVTAADHGVTPLFTQGDMARVDWSGIHQVEEDWRPNGDGTFMRQRFYRGARWMEDRSIFHVFPANQAGEVLDEPLVLHAGRDDRLRQSDDSFIRRFVARQIANPCPAVGDCTGATFTAQGLAQVRQALHADRRAHSLPAGTAQLMLTWTADPHADRRVSMSTIAAGDAPFAYGFEVRLEPVSTPASGTHYAPGETASFRLTFLDGAGNRLHPQGSLPTYGQFFRGEVTSGLRYFDNFRLSPTTFYALKHRESNVIVALSGPTDALRMPSGVVPLAALFAPEIEVASVAADGYSGVVSGVPPFGVTFGGLFDPAVWDSPVSDVVSLTIPADARPGTYVAAVKARRNYAGEALNRAATTTIQVGSATPTEYALKTIACTTCHTGPSALGRVLHGLDDRRACFACHGTLEVEPDTALDIRVHMMHDRSRRFPGNARDCLTCHLTMPAGPARGFLDP
ncbi:MAG: cytochrome c3 family protein [Gammaproteobacteria bacterium]